MTCRMLKQFLKSNAGLEDINLSKCGLQSIDEEIELLQQFFNLRQLDLGGNHLVSLPRGLAKLSKLISLNISHNPFRSIRCIIPILQQIPLLKSLSISFPSPQDQQLVLSSLPHLKLLNGTPLTRTGGLLVPARAEKTTTSEKPPQYLAGKSQLVRDFISDSFLDQAYKVHSSLKQATYDFEDVNSFDRAVRMSLLSLEKILEAEKDDYLRQTDAIAAKASIYQACLNQAARRAAELNPELGFALQKINREYQQLIKSHQCLIRDQHNHYLEEKNQNQDEIQASKVHISSLSASVEADESQIIELTNELKTLSKRNGELAMENQLLKHDLEESKKILKIPPPPVQSPLSVSAFETTSIPLIRKQRVVKTIGLKQLREIISQIYHSKKVQDKKCVRAKLPLETLEQHFYSYLNQQFGLKSLVVQHATAILKATIQYEKQDIEAAVFRNLIKNEIDQGFLPIKHRLEETIVELLRAYLRGTYPVKPDAAIVAMVMERCSDYIYEEECVEILKYIYNPRDRNTVMRRLNIDPETQEHGERKIKFHSFSNVLLYYQLEGRVQLLRDLRGCFRQEDVENTGTVTRQGLSTVLKLWDAGKLVHRDEAKIFRALDPFSNDSITFTQVVELLFDEIVHREELKDQVGVERIDGRRMPF